MKKLAYALIALFTLSAAVKAEETSDNPEVKRFAIEAGLGINLYLPFSQLRASYRLPYNDNRWDINLSHSIGAATSSFLYVSSLGTKYYFADNNPKPGEFTFQPFLSGAIGAAYRFKDPKDIMPILGGLIWPTILLGIGTDIHIVDNFQLSGALYTGHPIFFRPELNLKVRF